MRVRADVIIPFHGRIPMLLRCVSALAAGPRIAGTIFLVDDASHPSERDRALLALATTRQPLRWMHLPQHSGFVHAVNTAWQRCGSAIVILLNSDTIPSGDFLPELVGALERDPTLAAAAPTSDNPADLFQFRASASSADCARTAITIAPYLTAMCLAIRRSAVRGPIFDASFSPGYFEDLDLSCRLRASGWRLAILENYRIHHTGRATFALHPDLNRILTRNYSVFAARWSHLPEHASLTGQLGISAAPGVLA